MTTFNYTTGNPNNLTGGQSASMNDIQGPFVDVRTFLNGGAIDETNVPNLTAAFTTYRRIVRAATQISSSAASGTYLMQLGSTMGLNAQVNTGSASVGATMLYVDPALYTANTRSTKLNIRAVAVANAVVPNVTFTPGLYPVNTIGGASGTGPTIASLFAAVAGSTVALPVSSAQALVAASSGDFTIPAIGPYVLALALSASPAAGSVVEVIAQLEMRQV